MCKVPKEPLVQVLPLSACPQVEKGQEKVNSEVAEDERKELVYVMFIDEGINNYAVLKLTQ